MIRVGALCVRLLGWVLVGSLLDASPVAAATPLIAESDAYRVVLKEFIPCPDCSERWKLRLEVTAKETGNTSAVVLEAGIVGDSKEPPTVAIVGRHLLIVGDRINGKKALVVDLEPPFALLWSIKSQTISLSNKRDKVIYEGWRIRDFAQSQTAVLSLADIAAPMPTARVIYPPANAAKQQADPWEENPVDRHIIVSPIAWRGDDRKAVFFERVGTNNDFFLVEINMPSGEGKVETYRERIDVKEMLDRRVVTRDPVQPLTFSIEQIEWVDDSRIVASVRYKPYWKFLKVACFLPFAIGAKPLSVPAETGERHDEIGR